MWKGTLMELFVYSIKTFGKKAQATTGLKAEDERMNTRCFSPSASFRFPSFLLGVLSSPLQICKLSATLCTSDSWKAALTSPHTDAPHSPPLPWPFCARRRKFSISLLKGRARAASGQAGSKLHWARMVNYCSWLLQLVSVTNWLLLQWWW